MDTNHSFKELDGYRRPARIMVEVPYRFKQLVIKGTSTPVLVPPTVQLPAGGELPLTLVEPSKSGQAIMGMEDAYSVAADAFGINRDAAKKRVYRAIRSGLLAESGTGAKRGLNVGAFHQWLFSQQQTDDGKELDREEIEERIKQARAEKRRRA